MSRTIDQNSLNNEQNHDTENIMLFCNGDTRAFDRIVLKYQDQIVSLCVRTMGCRSDGEDAAQETFVKVFKNLHTFKSESLFSTWLYRIAINTCRNYQRSWWNKLKRRALRLDVPVTCGDDELKPEIADTTMTPQKDHDCNVLRYQIREALATLSQKHRELILLRDVQGFGYDEIEKILGINSGTLKSRLARARVAMQQKLRGKINGY